MNTRTMIVICAALMTLAGGFALVTAGTSGTSSTISYRYPYPISHDDDEPLDRRIEYFRTRARKDPQGSADFAALAALYLKRSKTNADPKDLDNAERAARVSIKNRRKGNIAAYVTLAEVAKTRHDFKKAVDVAKTALREDPRESRAFSIASLSLLALGDLQSASVMADDFVERLPGLASFTTRGLVHSAQGRDAEANADFEAALRVEGVSERTISSWARMVYGRFLFQRGKTSDARLLLEESLRIDPENSEAHRWLARVEEKSGNLVEAEALLQRAFQVSRSPEFLLEYARVRLAQGDMAKCQNLRDRAESLMRSSLKSNDKSQSDQLIRLLLERGQKNDATEALSLAAREFKSRAGTETLFLLSMAQFKNGQFASARASIRELLRTGVRDAEIYSVAAEIESALGNQKLAATYRQLASNLQTPDASLLASPNG